MTAARQMPSVTFAAVSSTPNGPSLPVPRAACVVGATGRSIVHFRSVQHCPKGFVATRPRYCVDRFGDVLPVAFKGVNTTGSDSTGNSHGRARAAARAALGSARASRLRREARRGSLVRPVPESVRVYPQPGQRDAPPERFDQCAPRNATPRCVVTTSWDDGHLFDLRLADLLASYDVAGTFYVAPHNVEFPSRALLNERGVHELSQFVEVGSHSVRHIRFTELSDAAVRTELRDSRDHLEQLLGRDVTAFCYPGGAHSPRHRDLLIEAGFRVGRTCEAGQLRVGDPLAMPVTMHARTLAGLDLDALAITRDRPLRAVHHLRSWESMAIDWFERALTEGGVFHLWGHSWELDLTRSWERLERVLEQISGHPEVAYLTNSEAAMWAPGAM